MTINVLVSVFPHNLTTFSFRLYSPTKEIQHPGTPLKNSDNWLKQDAVTPDLMRVRSSLSEKLEVIAIEGRKGERLAVSIQKTN